MTMSRLGTMRIGAIVVGPSSSLRGFFAPMSVRILTYAGEYLSRSNLGLIALRRIAPCLIR